MGTASESVTYSIEFQSVEKTKKITTPVILFKDAVNYLRISKEKLYLLVSNKEISHLRIGAKIIFYKEHLDDYLSSNEVIAVKKEVKSNSKTKK